MGPSDAHIGDAAKAAVDVVCRHNERHRRAQLLAQAEFGLAAAVTADRPATPDAYRRLLAAWQMTHILLPATAELGERSPSFEAARAELPAVVPDPLAESDPGLVLQGRLEPRRFVESV